MRLAAGACVLATGLLVGSAGGAIAAAEPESSASTSSSQSADQPNADAGASVAPAATTSHNKPKYPIRAAIQDALNKLRALSKPPVKQPAATKPTTTAAVPDADSDTTESDEATPPTADPVTADANAVTPELDSVTTDSAEIAPPPVTHAAATTEQKPPQTPTDLVGPALKAVAPVPHAMAVVAGNALSVPGLIMSLPSSPTPVEDVITSMTNMLVSVNDAVAPLAQVPGDLYSLLVVAGGMGAAAPMQVSNASPSLSAAAGATLAPPVAPILPPTPPMPPGGAVEMLGNVVAPTTLGGIATVGLTSDLSLTGTAPLAADSVAHTTALSILENTVKAVLAPASLSALAAFAIPGIGGLLIICAAGIRIGYRQAKAMLAVRATGLARFTRHGPMGVVRSGALVSLHTRNPRGARRPKAAQATAPLEQAA